MGGTKNKYQKCGNVTELKQSLWLCRTNTVTARQWESSQSQVPQKSFLCDHLQKFKLWGSSEILPGVMVLQKRSQPWEYRRQTMSSRVLSVDLRDFFYISLLEGQKCPMGDGRPPPENELKSDSEKCLYPNHCDRTYSHALLGKSKYSLLLPSLYFYSLKFFHSRVAIRVFGTGTKPY